MSELKKLIKLFERDANDLQNENDNTKEIRFSNQRKFNNLGARLYKMQVEVDREHAIEQNLKGYPSTNTKSMRKSYSMPATTLVENANKDHHDRIHGFSKFVLKALLSKFRHIDLQSNKYINTRTRTHMFLFLF
jgi:hypothetical protein